MVSMPISSDTRCVACATIIMPADAEQHQRVELAELEALLAQERRREQQRQQRRRR